MTAQEMFKKLQYDELKTTKEQMNYLCHYTNGDINYVRFYLSRKIIEVGMDDKSDTGEKLADYITLDVYKAITQQMKELGWLE
jgi:hypothetical protein